MPIQDSLSEVEIVTLKTTKWGGNLSVKDDEQCQLKCKEYDEVFFLLDHFAERCLDKLDDVQCHRYVTELETHIKYIQEHYQIEKF